MTPKKLFFGLLGVVVVTAAIIGYSYWYGNGLLTSTTANLSKQLAARDNADQTISQLIKLQRQYDTEVAPILPQLDNILPHNKDQTQILLQLQALANNAGLSITDVTLPNSNSLPSNTSQTVAASGMLALPITFTLTGTYGQLQQFLVQVENLDRFTSVTSLDISHPPGNKITYTMVINAYIKP